MSIHTFLSNLGITKGRKIILKSGAKANLTNETLDFAELGMTNEGELYIGAIDGSNILINSNSTEVLDNHITTVASTLTLGHVKVGNNIDVTNGVISIGDASTTIKGVVQIVDNLTTNDSTKVLSSAQGYALKQVIDSIGTGGGTGGTGGITLADIPDASMTQRGLMTSALYAKLNGISSGANFTSVENVLTSTSTTSALSAYQGKITNDKIVAHTADSTIHVTSTDKTTWNGYGSRIYTLENSSGNIPNIYQSGVATYYNGTAFGYNTNASNYLSFAIGDSTIASGNRSTAMGLSTISSGHYSTSMGGLTTSNVSCSVAIGLNNKLLTGNSTIPSSTDDVFVIGNGQLPTLGGNKSNAFRVKLNGAVYGLSAFNSTGADYAEYFEWQDGNSHNDERVGLVVTLDGDKIRKAKSEDEYILGVISANPSVIGDSVQDQYHGMYEKDEFGRNKTAIKDVEIIKVDENGNEYTDIEQVTEFIINPNYNPEEEYIPREQRKEWDAVGLVGKLITRQDGTAQVNGYVKVSDSLDGIVTHSDTRTEMRVMEVISDDLIRVFIK